MIFYSAQNLKDLLQDTPWLFLPFCENSFSIHSRGSSMVNFMGKNWKTYHHSLILVGPRGHSGFVWVPRGPLRLDGPLESPVRLVGGPRRAISGELGAPRGPFKVIWGPLRLGLPGNCLVCLVGLSGPG